jgi:hypothetical protein
MSSSDNIDLYRDFAAGVYLSEAENPIPLPPYTLYTCMQYICTYAHREGGYLNQRGGEKGNRGEYNHKAKARFKIST